jgi:hypothetical protein
VRAAVVVVLAPVLHDDRGFGQASEQLDVEQLVADARVKGLHERVLPRASGLDRGLGSRLLGRAAILNNGALPATVKRIRP